MRRKLQYIWQILIAVAYLGIVVGVLNVATTKFEVVVLGMLVQVYSAVLFNFSLIGAAMNTNNYAAFVRFRILSTAQGVTENEDGTFEEQEKGLADALSSGKSTVVITRLSHAAASIYALFKIVHAAFFW